MLERFDSIKQVGLFSDYSHSTGCSFGDVTLVYGENGVGKSTLAAILDSVREGNADEILRRTSLPGNVPPSVRIVLNGTTYTFEGSHWDAQPPYDTLDVFFPGFVARNVHAMTAVDSEHRRNLCEFVLGREAVKKVARLAEADTEARKALSDIKSVEANIKLSIKEPDTLDSFFGLPSDPRIEDKLEIARANLKQARAKDAILARPVPQVVQLPTLDSKAAPALLEKSAKNVGGGTAALVREHIHQHLDPNGEAWLAYGADHISDGQCPFCAQDLKGSPIVEAIRDYFSAEYRAYMEALSSDVQSLRNTLALSVFQDLRSKISAQTAILAQWVQEIPIEQTCLNNILDNAQVAWTRGEKALGELIEAKLANPLVGSDPSAANEMLAAYGEAFTYFDSVNETLALGGKKAEEQKATLSKADAAAIEAQVRRLENHKARFEPFAQELLTKRNALLEKRKQLEEEKQELKKAIDEYAGKVVRKYQDGINFYLNFFGCDIRIESVEPGYPSGKASVHYRLKAHGHEIPLGFSGTTPCFDTVLSEGDKYTLALSFFLARLKNHDDLAGRVIVLDDPVNSLGSARRRLVEIIVRDLRKRGAQTIVLTHDERLAALLWRDTYLTKIHPLQVQRTDSGSRLLPWDAERATQSEYVLHYLTLLDYLKNGGDHKAAAGSIRPYLEQRLRYIYPGPPLDSRDTLGRMIKKIRESKPGDLLQAIQEKVPELEALNDAGLPSHHATDDVPSLRPLSPTEVRLFAQKALAVLG